MTSFNPGLLVSGRYRVGHELGRGGSATVYAAFDETLDREVALKAWDPDSLHPIDPAAESRLTARLSHAGVVAVYDAGEHEGQAYLVMQRLDGGSLADALRDGPLGVERTRAIGRRLAQALAYVHSRGLVHGDVKPGNVLFVSADHDQCKLTDFGVASDGRRKRGAEVLGTPGYASPEQLRGTSATAASDVYSLGVVLTECLGDAEAPADVQDLLRAMTIDDPVRRPEAAEVARRLDVRHDSETVVFTPLPTQRLAPPRERHKALMLTGAIVLVFVALALTGARPDLGDRPSPTPTVHPVTPAPTAHLTQVAPVRQASPPARKHGKGHGPHHG